MKQRWEVEEMKENPLTDTAFKDLNLKKKAEILQALCDYRLDSVDVMDQLKVKLNMMTKLHERDISPYKRDK